MVTANLKEEILQHTETMITEKAQYIQNFSTDLMNQKFALTILISRENISELLSTNFHSYA